VTYPIGLRSTINESRPPMPSRRFYTSPNTPLPSVFHFGSLSGGSLPCRSPHHEPAPYQPFSQYVCRSGMNAGLLPVITVSAHQCDMIRNGAAGHATGCRMNRLPDRVEDLRISCLSVSGSQPRCKGGETGISIVFHLLTVRSHSCHPDFRVRFG